LAARFAVADYGAAMPTGGRGVVATNAVAMADALLAALASKPAAPPPAAAPVAYVPKVGDVVRVGDDALHEYLITRDGAAWGRELPVQDRFDVGNLIGPLTYLRPATPAERAAAGLSVEPTPEAPDARGEDARYVPKRGDVIRFSGGASGEAGALRVLLSPDPTSKWGAWKARALIGMRPTGDPIPTMAQHWTFVRAATTEDLLTILDVSKEV
jgi:hypothetical protein